MCQSYAECHIRWRNRTFQLRSPKIFKHLILLRRNRKIRKACWEVLAACESFSNLQTSPLNRPHLATAPGSWDVKTIPAPIIFLPPPPHLQEMREYSSPISTLTYTILLSGIMSETPFWVCGSFRPFPCGCWKMISGLQSCLKVMGDLGE
jgi:hypothetical protein